MDYLILCLAAAFTSALTLFSGFGLGTLILPAFAVFFAIETAVALTAIIHFLNNLLKLSLFGKYANRIVLARFGLPAIPAAMLGALLLTYLSQGELLWVYQIGSRVAKVTPIDVVIGVLILGFALFEIWSPLQKLEFDRKYFFAGRPAERILRRPLGPSRRAAQRVSGSCRPR